MTTIYEIRRANFLSLIEGDARTQEQLASDLGMPGQYSVSMFRTGSRNIGDTWARRIERKFDLPVGWMDTLHDPSRVAPAPAVQAQNGNTQDTEIYAFVAALYGRLPAGAKAKVREILLNTPTETNEPEQQHPHSPRVASPVSGEQSAPARRDSAPKRRSRRA